MIRMKLLRGACSARELADAAGVSQPTISRALSGMDTVNIGGGPTSAYALHENIENAGSSWPIYFIDENAAVGKMGTLHSLKAFQFWVERESSNDWQSVFGEDFKNGLFPGLPYFLDDIRPQGFLGRAFAKKYGQLLQQPDNPELWTNPGVIRALLQYGADQPGAFILGKEALSKALLPAPEIAEDCIQEGYPSLAAQALQNRIVGSSAGGEQPKFTATTEGNRGVLVKFATDLDTISGRRWSDLLAAENIALETLRGAGIPSAQSRIIDHENFRFLETERFDRTACGGRIPIVSLRAVASAFTGLGNTWLESMASLEQAGRVTSLDAKATELIYEFGVRIGNTDMHPGNLSFIMSSRGKMSIAPVYDMLPMMYRPDRNDKVSSEALIPQGSISQEANGLATIFWGNAAKSTLLSPQFRALAKENLELLSKITDKREAQTFYHLFDPSAHSVQNRKEFREEQIGGR